MSSEEDEFFDAPDAFSCNSFTRKWSDNEDDVIHSFVEYDNKNAQRRNRVESLKRSFGDNIALQHGWESYQPNGEELRRLSIADPNMAFMLGVGAFEPSQIPTNHFQDGGYIMSKGYSPGLPEQAGDRPRVRSNASHGRKDASLPVDGSYETPPKQTPVGQPYDLRMHTVPGTFSPVQRAMRVSATVGSFKDRGGLKFQVSPGQEVASPQNGLSEEVRSDMKGRFWPHGLPTRQLSLPTTGTRRSNVISSAPEMSSCTVSEFNQGAKAWAECFKSWSLDAARNQTNCPIPNQLQIPFQGERPNQSIFPNGTYPAVLPHMSVPTGVSADSLRNQFTDHLLHLPPSVASGSQLVSTMVQTGDNLPAVGPPSPTFQDSKQKFSDSKLSTRLPESSSGSLNDTKGATLNDSTLRNEQILNPIELRFRSLTASSVYAADGNSQATDLTIQTQPAEDRTNGKVGRFHKYFRDAVSAFKSATRAKIFNPVEESSDEDEEVIGNQGIRLRSSRQARGRREFLQLKLVQEMKNEHTGAIWAMRFSPCGRLLATAGYDRNIRIWVLRQWYPYFKRMQQQTVGAEGNPEFGPTGLIDNAYPAFDGSGGNLMDDENLLDSVSLASTSVSTAGKTDDGASTSSSTQAYLSTKESVVNMSDNRSADQLVSSSLKVPDLERGRRTVFRSQPLLVYRGHEGVVTEVAWSKNLFLLATSMDHQVRLWHISRRECLCLFSHNDTVPTIVFHPKDDRYFLSGSLDGKLRLWNIPDKKVRFWVEVPMPSALPIPAAPGSFTVSNLFKSSPPSTPQVSSISGISRTFVPKTIITCAMFACDGTKVVVGTYDGRVLFFNSELAYITFIAIKSGTAKGRQCRVTAIEIDPTDSNKILVTSNDSRLRLIDARDYHTLCKYRGFVNETSQIRASFSPTGRYLISGSENSFFYIWRKTLDVERISRFSRIRKDRNNCWEAIKAHDTMVTVALFCPNPNMVLDKHLRHCRFPYSLSPGDAQGSSVFRLDALPPNADPRHEMSYLGEVVVSADCNGCIRVFKKYASSESQLGTTGSKSVR